MTFIRGWIQGNVNQFCPKCKQPIKIDDIAPGPETGVIRDVELSLKTEKLNDLNFELNNVIIMNLFNEILMDYTAKDINLLKAPKQDIIKRIFADIITTQESSKDLGITLLCFFLSYLKLVLLNMDSQDPRSHTDPLR